MTLTLEQNYVVHKSEGHIVVLAGPGSGKTHTLIEKILYLFAKDVIPAPYGLLAITFTNAAASEIRSRLRSKGFQQLNRIWVGTFHAFGSYLLSCYGGDVGIREDFGLLEKDAQDGIIKYVANKCAKGVPPSNLKFTFERLKRKGIYPEINDEKLDARLRIAYREYQNKLAERNSLDFGDLVALSVRLLKESSLASRLFKNYFRYIVVDEFQDSDSQQLEMIYLLGKGAIGSTIVADDDQSIYKFRGAVRENVYKIEELLNAEKIILQTNFRSDQIIVEAAKSIIDFETNRLPKHIQPASKNIGFLYKKQFENYSMEASEIANLIKNLTLRNQVDLGEIAVITRNRVRVNAILSELDLINVRWFDRSRLSFQDSWETSLCLAILSLSCDLHSSSQLRKVLDVIESEGLAFRLGDEDALDVAVRIRNQLLEKLSFIPGIKDVEAVIEISQLDSLINAVCLSSADSNRITDNLSNLVDDLRKEAASLELELPAAIERLAGYKAVQIMSGHASKGREFDYVFMAGLEDDVIPFYKTHKNEQDIAEERRIFYVSITRARKAVYLTSAARTTGNWQRKPSRFIRHIPEEFFSSFPKLEP